MEIKCPHCETVYEIEKKDLYRYTECEVCGKGFVTGAKTSLLAETKPEKTTDTGSSARSGHDEQSKLKSGRMDGKDDVNPRFHAAQSQKRVEIPPRFHLPNQQNNEEAGRRDKNDVDISDNGNAATTSFAVKFAVATTGAALLLAVLIGAAVFLPKCNSSISLDVGKIDENKAEIIWNGRIIDEDEKSPAFPQFRYSFTTLDQVALDNCRTGAAYIYRGDDGQDNQARILQIYPGKGYLVSFGECVSPLFCQPERIFLLTSRNYEVDGLPLSTGAYIYSGLARIRVADNIWHTVRVFKEMTSQVLEGKWNSIKSEIKRKEIECEAERSRRKELLRLEEERRRKEQEEEERRRVAQMNRMQKLERIGQMRELIGELKKEINDVLNGVSYKPFNAAEAKETNPPLDIKIEEPLASAKNISTRSSDNEIMAELESLEREITRLNARLDTLENCYDDWQNEQRRRADKAKTLLSDLDFSTHYAIHDAIVKKYSLDSSSIETEFDAFNKLVAGKKVEEIDYLGVLSAIRRLADKSKPDFTKFPTEGEIAELAGFLLGYEFKVGFHIGASNGASPLSPDALQAIRYSMGTPAKPIDIKSQSVNVTGGRRFEFNMTLGSITAIYPSGKIFPQYEFQAGNRPFDNLKAKLGKKMQEAGLRNDSGNDTDAIKKARHVFADFDRAMKTWLHPPKAGISVTSGGLIEDKPDPNAYQNYLQRQNAAEKARHQNLRDRGMLDMKRPE